MFNISPLEMIILLVIALIVLGPQKLPEMARSLGRGMREFRAALSAESEERGGEPYEDETEGVDGDEDETADGDGDELDARV